jgi:prepilin-type N-terminal cleavage/methylation domain-containing protein
MRRAFTLIELLVVATIIVVLLALLSPALDRAVYEAEMAVCGSNQKSLGTGIFAYAMNNKRRYPYREHLVDWYSVPLIIKNTFYEKRYDDRPMLRPYISVTKTLSCPHLPQLDLEDQDPPTSIFATYNLWFGLRYRGDSFLFDQALGTYDERPGLFKMGDRLHWYDNIKGEAIASNVLAASRYVVHKLGTITYGSHPGESYYVFTNTDAPYGISVRALVTYYQSDSNEGRGPVDLNALFDDGGVRRYNEVHWDTRDDAIEDRFYRVPAWNNSSGWDHEWWENIPKR